MPIADRAGPKPLTHLPPPARHTSLDASQHSWGGCTQSWGLPPPQFALRDDSRSCCAWEGSWANLNSFQSLSPAAASPRAASDHELGPEPVQSTSHSQQVQAMGSAQHPAGALPAQGAAESVWGHAAPTPAAASPLLCVEVSPPIAIKLWPMGHCPR